MNAARKNPKPVSSDASSVWIVALLALVPCLTAAVFGSQNSNGPPCLVTTSRPALVFSEYLADYGPAPVPQQPTLTPVFYLRNNGSEKVQITGMDPSCGCLAPSISAQEINPGAIETLTLPIRLSNEPSGFREYTVTVSYSDPKPRRVTLSVKAVLPEKSLIIEPRVLMVMGAVSAGQQHIVTVSDFRSESAEKPMKVTGVTGSSSLFTAELVGQLHREGATQGFRAKSPSWIPRRTDSPPAPPPACPYCAEWRGSGIRRAGRRLRRRSPPSASARPSSSSLLGEVRQALLPLIELVLVAAAEKHLAHDEA